MRLKRIPEVGKIKSAIVFIVGTLCGFGGAVTGIGAQAAYSPSLVWMFGYAPERATGVGLRFAFWTALIATFAAGYLTPGYHITRLLDAVLLFLGGTVGALLAIPLRPLFAKNWSRTFGKVFSVVVGLVTLILALKHNPFSGDFGVGGNHTVLLLGAAVGTGLFAAVFAVVPAFLLIPALVFFVGESAPSAILLSLATTVLASLLPLVGYRAQGMTEGRFSDSGLFGGAIGAVVGGILLAHLLKLNSVWSLAFFAPVAMFLSSRETAPLAKRGDRKSNLTQRHKGTKRQRVTQEFFCVRSYLHFNLWINQPFFGGNDVST